MMPAVEPSDWCLQPWLDVFISSKLGGSVGSISTRLVCRAKPSLHSGKSDANHDPGAA